MFDSLAFFFFFFVGKGKLRENNLLLFLFFVTMGDWISSHIPQLMSRAAKVYSRVLTLMALRGLELMTIGEQTQGVTTKK